MKVRSLGSVPAGIAHLRTVARRWLAGRSACEERARRSALAGRIASSLWVVAACGVLVGPAHAERVPKEGPQDPRIRTVVYNPRDVVKIEATYGYHTLVEFADDEVIQTLLIGDSVAWEAERSAAGNRISLKPKEENTGTNLTVITDRRTYSFALQAGRATAASRMTWRLRFEYPEEDAARREAQVQRAELQRASFVNPDAPANPGRWNFEYSYGGTETLRPAQLFDDGEFTYFKFGRTSDLPAVFVVDAQKNEALVNARVSGEYLVVHRVAKQFALRSGAALTCIFNEAFDAARGQPVNAPRPAGSPALPAQPATGDVTKALGTVAP
jgi:type IV secretion system protein VirB9